MAIEIKVPTVGESINEVTLVKWLKKDGEYANRDEVIAELESEKATFEINAEQAGTLKIIAQEGDTLKIGDLICSIDTDAAKPAVSGTLPTKESNAKVEIAKPTDEVVKPQSDVKATPVAAAIIADKKVDVKGVTASGSNGKIIKQDVLDALNSPGRKPGVELFSRNDRPEKMSNLRKTISRRLVEAKNTTAMLTTFNEVDMGPVMEIRKQYKDKFKEAHGVNLGFMSFFTKACCYALQEFKSVNEMYLKYLKIFEEFDSQGYESHWDKFQQWLSQKDFDLYDGLEDLKSKFMEIANDDSLAVEEKSNEIAAYLDEKWGLYDGYMDVVDYLESLFMDEDEEDSEYDEN